MSEDIPQFISNEIRLTGVAASPGVVVAPIVVFSQDNKIIRRRKIKPEDIPAEMGLLEVALVKTRQEILEIKEKLEQDLAEQDAAIFDAHLLVLEDPTIIEAVKSQLAEKLLAVDYIYQQTTKSFIKQLRQLDDEFLSERATDIQDVSRRVLRNLQGRSGFSLQLDVPSIIVAHDLTPSDTVQLDRKMVLGFATEAGSRTSHTAIMARSLDIPAVVSLKQVLGRIESGVEALLDGHEGILVINPSEQTKQVSGQIEGKRLEVDQQLTSLRDVSAVTTDQKKITVSANVGLDADIPMMQENGAEGVGLYRTEFLYINREGFPTEEEQFEKYRSIAQAAKPHSVIIRTLDIGGDKFISNNADFIPEQNPFLGWRGIRYCLAEKAIFKTQLRAICRASIEGNIKIMFPMVSDIDEFRRARSILEEVKRELRNDGVAIAEKMEVGVMIEVPSAAMTAEFYAREANFLSIGTNDLIQYTLAVDRVNEKVSYLYQPTHPSILRLIKQVVDAGHKHNIWVGVCGEMASDIKLTPLLLGLGVDELSLGSGNVPRIKKAIQSLSFEETQKMVAEWMDWYKAEDIMRALEEYAQRLYPDLL
jgi:phosphotransferase system enzyme I (PtsI)